MTDRAWELCKQLATEVGKARQISDKEIQDRYAVMQAQDFYNLFNILKQPEKYDASKICKELEKELEK